MDEPRKITLNEEDIPAQWYNIQADLENPLPAPLHPQTLQPARAEDLAAVFPENIIEQEMSTTRWIDIPEEIRESWLMWRPTPLYRAVNLEKALETPAKIYYKHEGVSPPGSHKPNSAVAQVYYNKAFGINHITTETGAGQWGSALAFACNQFGLDLKVFMVRVSFDQKPLRKLMMQTWGADCLPSPNPETATGQRILAEYPDTPGSLGIAISEAMEAAVNNENTRYSLGSVLNHVCLHQTVIGLETKKQFQQINAYPDVVIGCIGGGSNFAGVSFPFACDKIHGQDVRILGCEPAACPTLTKGPYVYDHGDSSGMTPLLPMHSLGHDFIPPSVHAGGLRYHGAAPVLSRIVRDGLIEAQAFHQLECYEAAVKWARTEGFIPAPETSHAIAGAIKEAEKAREEQKERRILLGWSGHGLMDLSGYRAYFNGELCDYEYPQEEIEKSLDALSKFPKPE